MSPPLIIGCKFGQLLVDWPPHKSQLAASLTASPFITTSGFCLTVIIRLHHHHHGYDITGYSLAVVNQIGGNGRTLSETLAN